MGLTLLWDSARYRLYTSCTAEAKKHDGIREKLRGLDYGDQRSKRRVVHSVPYLTIRANRIPKPDFRKAWEKARSRSGSQYNNFNSFNGLSSDSPLLYYSLLLGISLRPLGYSVYSLLYLLCHSNYFTISCTGNIV
jgi:hypothetical protein